MKGSVVMPQVHRRYRALLEVSNVLNSQREMDSLWQACTERIKEVVSWERAGVLLYVPDEDGFRFHALETSLPKRVLQRGAIIPRAGSAVLQASRMTRPWNFYARLRSRSRLPSGMCRPMSS